MKKIIFSLIMFMGFMSVDAQVVKLMKGSNVIAGYNKSQVDQVAFEDPSTVKFIKGTKTLATFTGTQFDKIVYDETALVTGITLTQSSLSLSKGQTKTLTATMTPSYATNQSVSWSSSNTNVATVTSNGLVTAIAGGNATITAKANDGSGVSATCAVTVSDGPSDSHEYVDLGLPSGTLWATCNVGADKPEEYGLYFAWGETTGYTSDTSDGHYFDWANYKWCNGSSTTMTKYCNSSRYGTVDNKTVLESADDAATVNWGSNWCMPTHAQQQELVDSTYTSTERTTLNGVEGRKITSKTNGNSLFLPAAGCREHYLYSAGAYGYYWSSEVGSKYSYDAWELSFDFSSYANDCPFRYYGLSVRAVRSASQN